jgi:putative two-component system response regulator
MSERVLVIDDEPVALEVMAEILAVAGYDVVLAFDAGTALRRLADDEGIALVVSDIVMPGLSGIELLGHVHELRPSLPVVVVTGAATEDNLGDALAAGADGLVVKPFRHATLHRAVEVALDRSARRERELRRRLLTPTLAGVLANAIEARQPSLGGHCERLASLAVRLAGELGLSEREVEIVRLGATLHDVGKIAIPDRILLKPGPLEREERTLMQTHALVGSRLLEPVETLRAVREVVRHHHERWDGRGYPDGLAGEGIPLAARIVAVADAIEAMSSPRVYRGPLEPEQVLEELERGHGSQWDPAVVDAALRLAAEGEISLGGSGGRLAEAAR